MPSAGVTAPAQSAKAKAKVIEEAAAAAAAETEANEIIALKDIVLDKCPPEHQAAMASWLDGLLMESKRRFFNGTKLSVKETLQLLVALKEARGSLFTAHTTSIRYGGILRAKMIAAWPERCTTTMDIWLGNHVNGKNDKLWTFEPTTKATKAATIFDRCGQAIQFFK
jgi:hypothetical protein